MWHVGCFGRCSHMPCSCQEPHLLTQSVVIVSFISNSILSGKASNGEVRAVSVNCCFLKLFQNGTCGLGEVKNAMDVFRSHCSHC